MSTRRILIPAFALAALLAPPAQASCIQSTEAQNRNRADAVFVGRMLSFRESDGSALFRVRRVIKGRLRRGARVRVTPDHYPSSITIGWTPKAGQRWRVYADRRNDRWETNDCMGTRRA